MPVTPVDSGFVDIPSTAPSSTWTLTLPADTQSGDVFVLELAIAILNSTNQVSSVPSGAVTIMAPSSGAGNSIHAAAYAWAAPATPPASVSFGLAASHYGSIAWLRLRGADAANMLSGTPAVAGWVSATSVTVPAMTTAHPNAYVVGGINLASGSRTVTPPSGWTARANGTERLGHLSSEGTQATAGSTGTAVFAVSGTATYLRAWQAAIKESAATTPSLTQVTLGDPTDSSLTVSVKTADAASVRVKMATDTALTQNVAYSASATPDSAGYSKHTVTGRSPFTRYYYAVEMTPSTGSVVTTATQGSTRTLPSPGSVASYSGALGSCLDTGSTQTAAFTRIQARDPLFFAHTGDFHYADNTSTAQSSHRADLESQINVNSGLRDLLKNTSIFSGGSDHDTGGGNNALPGSYTAPNRDARKQVFAYPTLTDPNGLYYAKAIGRVLWIFTDQRYLRTASPSGSVLGATQKQWLKDRLVDPAYPLKIWVTDSVFNISDAPGGEDKWSDYPTEQDEIGDFIRDSAYGDVIIATGDQHALAADNGSGNVWGIPSVCAAPFDRVTSHKGGPWSAGRYPTTTGAWAQQYGWIDISDQSTQIVFTFTGYDSTNTARVTYTQTTPTLTQVTKTVATGWAVRRPVVKTTATAWNVVGGVAKTVPTAWNVRSRVTKTLATTWAARVAVARSVAAAWNVRTRTVATKPTAWNVRAVVAKTAPTAWAVRQQVVRTRSTAWHVRGRVVRSLPSTWAVRVGLSKSLATAWTVRQRVLRSVATAWDVGVQEGRVIVLRPTAWNIRARVPKIVTTGWAVRLPVSTTRSLAWRIDRRVVVVKVTAWDVRARVVRLTPTAWRVGTGMALTVPIAWRVEGGFVVLVPIAWSVLGRASITVKGPTSRTFTVRGPYERTPVG